MNDIANRSITSTAAEDVPPDSVGNVWGSVMRTAILFLCAATILIGLSGCNRGFRRFGPPPPAYACDGYGCDGYDAYGGFSECVDDGQYYSRRGLRRSRRDDRRLGRNDRHGHTYNGLPVVAAYIVPMEMGMDSGFPCGDCVCGGGWETCPGPNPCSSCGSGWQTCPSCGPHEGMIMGECGPEGCGFESEWQSEYDAGLQPMPSEAYPPSYDGNMLTPVPAPPAQEGPWNPPGTNPATPRTTPDPTASRPAQSANWLPASF